MHLGHLRTIWDVLRDLAAFFWGGPLSFLSSFINEDVRFSQIQNRGVVTGHVIPLWITLKQSVLLFKSRVSMRFWQLKIKSSQPNAGTSGPEMQSGNRGSTVLLGFV